MKARPMWNVADTQLESRFLLGTARYPSPASLSQAIKRSQTQIVTVSLRRQAPEQSAGNTFWEMIQSHNVHLLPNTAGCHSVKEAVTTAHMARDVFKTNWIKLETLGDDYNLQPNPFDLVEAAGILVKDGFEVFPYTTDDLVVADKLLNAGCRILMPWGAPIGTGQGLANPNALKTLRARFPDVPMIIDAGIGSPSHALQAMEMGYDAILLNSAVALSQDPPAMAEAFGKAIQAGRLAFEAGIMPTRDLAEPSTPVVGTPFWHHKAS